MKYILIFLIVLGLGFAIFSLIDDSRQGSVASVENTSAPVGGATGPSSNEVQTGASGITAEENVREITIEGGMFYFEPKEIRVKKGDTVNITLINKEGMHDWVVDEFNARIKKINAGESDSVTFVADKTGSFEYYCSVANHRAQGMKGTLIVE